MGWFRDRLLAAKDVPPARNSFCTHDKQRDEIETDLQIQRYNEAHATRTVKATPDYYEYSVSEDALKKFLGIPDEEWILTAWQPGRNWVFRTRVRK